jgi:MarR family transcriptional regulator, organic hydroperoxide resistance regulator
MATTADTEGGGNVESELSPAMREAMEAQRAIYKAVLGLNSDEWLSLDLSMGQLKALVTLTARRGMTVSEVAEALGVGKPAASMLVDRLTQHGYASRHEDPDDRRRTVVTPTQAGEDLVTRLRQSGGEQAMFRWIRQMAPDDLAALTRGARALAAIIAREGRG